MTPKPAVFITGVTGSQGGNLARQLRELGWSVHATVRNPQSDAAKALKRIGAELTPGDWNDHDTLKASMAGCTMLFLNLIIPFENPEHERVQAAGILSIAKASGVRHVIYSSSLTADRPQEITAMGENSLLGKVIYSKHAIEKLVKGEDPEVAGGGFETWTILRGACFMENFLLPKVTLMYPDLPKTGVWTQPYPGDTTILLVDTIDIAKFAVAAFKEPERFNHKEIGIAGEWVAARDVVGQLAEATGRQDMQFVALSSEEIEQQKKTNPMIRGQITIGELHRFMNVGETEAWGIPMATFRDFLERNKELVNVQLGKDI